MDPPPTPAKVAKLLVKPRIIVPMITKNDGGQI